MTRPTIDPAAFAALNETAGADFVRELIDTFLAEAPAMLASLEQTHAGRDAASFRRAAHSLKSNANTFGAHALGELARALELADVTTVPAAGPGSLAALRDEYARAAAALAELRDA